MAGKGKRNGGPGPKADLIVRGGTVFDGGPGEPYRGDVAVEGRRIAGVGDLGGWSAHGEIDAQGMAVAPGFIDVHTHDDAAVIDNPGMRSKVQQGVTTVVVGNCGISLAPIVPEGEPLPGPFWILGDNSSYRFATMEEYHQAVKRAAPSVNVVTLVGHTTLRAAAMADLSGPASDGELAEMKDLLDRSLSAGCAGMSTGLAYPPAFGAPTQEVVELAEVVGRKGGIYATHIRDEADHLIEAVEEALTIAGSTGSSLLVSHHKCAGKENWGKSRKTLEMINAALDSMDIGMDVYPYTASSTVLLAKKVRHAERIIVTQSGPHPELAGKDLSEIAAGFGCTEEEAVERLDPAMAIYFQMSEDDLARIMKHPRTMIGSDGLPSDRHPHPRLFGTFPRVLGKYVREDGLLSLAEAVRKMTSLPAGKFGLKDRGGLREGAYADIVVFDPETVIDRATYLEPAAPPEGIGKVVFEGRVVHG